MDPESQAQIKRIAETGGLSKDELVVVLGASDIEGAEISAETVTFGDPSYTGPLAGVPLGLPVYHILEPALREFIPESVYEANVGIWSMAADTEEIGRRFEAIRDKVAKG
jgi:glycine/sarcosine/betaine reductase complex component A